LACRSPLATAAISPWMEIERVAEAVELGLRLALGGLDHERAGDGEGHRRRVIAVVHEALGDVLDLEAVLLPRAELEDALVGDEPRGALVEHGEERLEALGDVVGVEDGELRGAREAVGAHHADIHPGDDEDAGAAPRARR
jgi:hypothetical protein